MDAWKPREKSNSSNAHAYHEQGSKVVAEYVYRTPKGEPYLKVLRYEPKSFRQQKWNGSGWEWGKPDSPKLPYLLPEMLKAVHTTVVIVEGEKDADRLTSLGFVATTSSQGAGKWSDDLAQWFEGKKVFIVADADKPGRDHAQQVARSIYSVAESVRLIEMPFGKDISEWLDQGGDTATVIDYCEGFSLRRLETAPAQPQDIELVRLSNVEAESVEWLWPRRL